MAALPHTDGFADEILLMRTHHTGYAHALRVSGARIVDIGHNDRGTGAGVRGIESWEIEAALTPRTAAFAFAANPATLQDLPTVVAACYPRGVPVIVDAAAQLPPKENLRRCFELGADLVAFSGGKAIGGPQASGILAGRADLIGAALVQQLDMDVSPETWAPPAMIDRAAMKGVPHHGLGRGFKAGKEEIVGLLTALERYAGADERAANAELETRLERIAQGLGELLGVTSRMVPASEGGRVPRLHLSVDSSAAGFDALELSRRLQGASVPIHLSERFAKQGILMIDPQALRAEDDAALIAGVRLAVAA
jgi:L-seryl-tRNA(Ser) seleniumtransferase